MVPTASSHGVHGINLLYAPCIPEDPCAPPIAGCRTAFQIAKFKHTAFCVGGVTLRLTMHWNNGLIFLGQKVRGQNGLLVKKWEGHGPLPPSHSHFPVPPSTTRVSNSQSSPKVWTMFSLEEAEWYAKDLSYTDLKKTYIGDYQI